MKKFSIQKMRRALRLTENKISPESVELVLREKVVKYKGYRKKECSVLNLRSGYITLLHPRLPSLKNMVLCVSLDQNPEDRLFTFVHEALHIHFHVFGEVPREKELTKPAHILLEKEIDKQTKIFIATFPEFSKKLFEEKFGFQCDDSLVQ